MLFAPAIKSRFETSDVLIYLLPFALFSAAVIITNLVLKTSILKHLYVSLSYILIFLPPFIAFFIGDAQELTLLIKIGANCGLAVLIILFPWDKNSIDTFFLFCSILGAILAINTMMYLGTDADLDYASDTEKTGYITVSVAIGFGCIAGMYLIFEKFIPIHIVLFILNWLGLALGRGRGAFLFGVVISAAYLIFILLSRNRSMTILKRLGIAVFIVGFSPIVYQQLMSLGQNQSRWERLFKDFDIEIDDGNRGSLLSEAIQKISEAPILGNGLGEYMMYDGHPHNIFLQFGVDAGVLGMLLLLLFILKVAYVGINNILLSDKYSHNLACGSILMFSFIFANMLKSGDAYLGRELFILSSLPFVIFLIPRRTDPH